MRLNWCSFRFMSMRIINWDISLVKLLVDATSYQFFFPFVQYSAIDTCPFFILIYGHLIFNQTIITIYHNDSSSSTSSSLVWARSLNHSLSIKKATNFDNLVMWLFNVFFPQNQIKLRINNPQMNSCHFIFVRFNFIVDICFFWYSDSIFD